MRLKAKSKRLLDLLLMSGMDALSFMAHPKGLIYDSVGWESHRSARRNLVSLQENGLVSVSHDRRTGKWVVALTQLGRSFASGKFNPEESWASEWNGRWTAVSFDLPQSAYRERSQLGRWLRENRFGCLQGSLWITHRGYREWADEIRSRRIDPSAALFYEIVSVGPTKNRDYAARSWSFKKIDNCYADYLNFVNEGPSLKSNDHYSKWLEMEKALWNKAFEQDPFLPDSLLPNGYLGKRAWNERKALYRSLAKEGIQH